MILQKTSLQEIPKTCKDCPIICRLPTKKSTYEHILKKEFFNKRHEKCPLVTKSDICTEFIQRVYELSEKDGKKLPLEFWIGQVLREMEKEE